MDYDFSRLTARSFEQLAQSLATKFLGPGVTVFGDGRDGGREATFERLMTYPTQAEPWDSYGVVQAKFRQKLTTPRTDGSWVAGELQKELGKFASSERALKKPRYYILVTNVALSSVADVGAKDKVRAVFERYRSKIGLRDYCIWDYDQLRAMLDNSVDVRRCYSAWTTPGDVLTAIVESINGIEPNFTETIINYVQKELASDELVRLNQAGAADRDATSLASVFTDLPLSYSNDEVSPAPASRGKPRYAIRSLVEVGNEVLSRSASAHSSGDLLSLSASRGRVVFLGGPGQGKTTLSQFICQLHRAAILSERCPSTLLPETCRSVSAILQQARIENTGVPKLARFPVRIILNNFATDLAQSKVQSVLDYMKQKIEQRTQRDLKMSSMRAWLKAYPWLVVLDGLDEVPSSSNRDEVLSAVRDLLVDINDADADVLVLATTRPQGYNEEFSPAYFLHKTLSPLNVEQALKYAESLVRQRWGADEDKVQELQKRLARAGAEESTARLMRSPLQVTIMALLVESLGIPPKERWRLFKEYFQVIVRREKERAIPSAGLLNLYEPDINYIHKAVGFELQRISETRGHTDATLPASEFSKLVQGRLTAEGHSGKEAERLEDEITGAALDRLVFLVSPRDGQVGFEIRSLQEFMAAEYLTDGSDSEVLCRLQSIAAAAHWRNVFLFATGRCFHERQHLRRPLYSMLCELNEATACKLDGAVLIGSQLALDILEDGSILQQPEQLRLYTRLAMRLVELPPCEDHGRLAAQYTESLADIFRAHLETTTAVPRSQGYSGGWRVLAHLADEGVAWAAGHIERSWPTENVDIEPIVDSLDRVGSPVLVDRWRRFVLSYPPGRAERFIKREHGLVSTAIPPWLRTLINADEGMWRDTVRIEGVNASFELTFSPVESGNQPNDGEMSEHAADILEADAAVIHPGWIWLRGAASFAANPDANSLAALLRDYHRLRSVGQDPEIGASNRNIAWPLAALLSMIREGADGSSVAEQIENGKLGSFTDWAAAQARWQKSGLRSIDLDRSGELDLPFDSQIAERGYPINQGGSIISHDDFPDAIRTLIGVWSTCSTFAKRGLASHVIFVASVAACHIQRLPEEFANELEGLLVDPVRNWAYVGILGALPDSFWLSKSAASALNAFGVMNLHPLDSRVGPEDRNYHLLEDLAVSNRDTLNIVKCLAACCIDGYVPRVFHHASPQMPPDELGGYCVLIALAGRCPAPSSVLDWVKVVVACRSVDGYVASFCALVMKHALTGETVECLLLALYNEISVLDVVTRRQIMRVLRELHRRKLSALSDEKMGAMAN